MSILSNLTIILIGIIANIVECKRQWSQIAQDQTLIGQGRFGGAVGTSNGYAIIGAPLENIGDNTEAGAAYIYKRTFNGIWILVQRLQGAVQTHGRFGTSVGISNGNIIIGAPLENIGNNTRAGAAYIYKRVSYSHGNWSLVQKLEGPETPGLFGADVRISDGYLIIGASYIDPEYFQLFGAAYIYERLSNGTWNLAQRFTPNKVDHDTAFGVGVDISNTYAIIGAPFETGIYGYQAGAAYIYKRAANGSWNLAQRLEAGIGGESYDRFGNAVAISNGYVVIGTFQGDIAYIYERAVDETWNLAQTIQGDYPSNYGGNFLGWSVGISNEYIIIGDPAGYFSYVGAVYIYRRDDNGVWLFSQELGVSGAVSEERYGVSVAISNGYIFSGTDKNKVYFYDGNNGSCECSSSC